MAETRAEFANAVQEALDWLGMTPEDAAPLVGLNSRTLGAMCQGIVPMRSLIIRFAAEMARLRDSRSGAADWWGDVDAWLRVAGLPPRREVTSAEPNGSSHAPTEALRGASYRLGGPAGSRANGAGGGSGLNGGNGSSDHYRGTYSDSRPRTTAGPSVTAPSTSVDATPASSFYRPQYERLAWGDSFVHVFWILDVDGRRAFQIRVAPNYDYKARAAEVKRDLAALSRAQFERKYGRFRIDGR